MDTEKANQENALRHAQADAESAREKATANFRLYTGLRKELDKAIEAAETAIEEGVALQERIKAMEWLVRTMRGELKLSGKHDSNCGSHDGRPCDCPYGRVLDLAESDYPRCPQ